MRGLAGAALLVLFVAGCGGTTGHVRATATPRAPLVDETVRVRVTGLEPGERVAIRSSWIGESGEGVFRARADGTVDTTRDASIGGTYRGRDAGGLFWSMRGDVLDGGPGPVEIGVFRGSTRIASTQVDWQVAAPGTERRVLTVAADGLAGTLFTPRHPKPTAVVLLGGSEGGTPINEAALLAAHGHPTLALAYFAAPGLRSQLARIRLEYFRSALAWLAAEPGVRAVDVVGASYGAEAALLVASTYPQLVHGVAALAPSSVVTSVRRETPAWTLRGRPLVTGTPIDVTPIRAPVLLAAGGLDALWPSAASAELLAAELRSTGRSVTLLEYPRAGHAVGFAIPNVPLRTVIHSRYGTLGLGGSREADAHARADLWPKLLAFLDR